MVLGGQRWRDITWRSGCRLFFCSLLCLRLLRVPDTLLPISRLHRRECAWRKQWLHLPNPSASISCHLLGMASDPLDWCHEIILQRHSGSCFRQSSCCPQQLNTQTKAVQPSATYTPFPHFLRLHTSFLLFPGCTGTPSSFSSSETALPHTGCQHSQPVLDPDRHHVNTERRGTTEKIGRRREQMKHCGF